MGVAAFKARRAFDDAMGLQIGGEAEQEFLAEVDVGDFAAAELDHGFDAVPFPEEADGVVLFEVVVVVVRIGPELQLFDVDDVLFAFGVVRLFFLLVLPLAIVHGFGDGRLGGGRDDDQIQSEVFGLAHGGGGGHDLHGAIGEDGAYFSRSDCFIDVLSNLGARKTEGSVWIHSDRIPSVIGTGCQVYPAFFYFGRGMAAGDSAYYSGIAMSLAPGQQIGDYRILQELGAGGMGKVFKVQNVISDRLEAMKVLLPDLSGNTELADRFLREIKVQASLEHPNIARLHTAMRDGNQLLMLMEFVEGRTVESLFTPERPLPLDYAVWCSMQVLSALGYAHERGIVHRDIKPSNMMLTSQGQIKLLDFGIARVVNDPSLTQTRQTMGSLFYMSPEQINGQPVDSRSDLYSLGISLYQMVTGRKPFEGTSEFSIMAAHMQQQSIPPIQIDPAMPQALNDVILRAMAKDANQRYQSAGEFYAALDGVLRVLQGGGAAAPAAVAATMPSSGGGGGLVWKLGAVALLVALVAGGGLVWWKLRRSAAEPVVTEPVVTAPAAAAPAGEAVPEGKSEPSVETATPVALEPAEPAAAPAPGVAVHRLGKLPPELKGARTAEPAPSAPVAPVPAPASAAAAAPVETPAAPPRLGAAEASELRARRVRVQSRLEACKAAMNHLRETLASQGLKPRGDIAALLETVASEIGEGEAAMQGADAEGARQHFSVAEQALRKAERFFNL